MQQEEKKRKEENKAQAPGAKALFYSLMSLAVPLACFLNKEPWLAVLTWIFFVALAIMQSFQDKKWFDEREALRALEAETLIEQAASAGGLSVRVPGANQSSYWKNGNEAELLAAGIALAKPGGRLADKVIYEYAKRGESIYEFDGMFEERESWLAKPAEGVMVLNGLRYKKIIGEEALKKAMPLFASAPSTR